MASFLSRFKAKKDKPTSGSAPVPLEQRRQSGSKTTTVPVTPTSPSFLPLDIPNPSLLDDSVLSTPSGLRRGDDTRSIRSDASPWIKLDEAGPNEEGLKGKQEREAKEKTRCERAVFGVEDATVLMKECGAVIRDHGERLLSSPSSES